MADACIVCGSHESNTAFVKNNYEIRRCELCDFEYVNTRLSNNFARDFYTEDFFQGGHDKYGYADYLGEEANLIRWNAKKTQFMERYIKSGSILDIGCAAGFFLRGLGPAWDRYGCEASSAMAKIARETLGDRVQESVFEDYSSDCSFDGITMWDFIEHVIDPVACIKKAWSLLKEDGFLFIGTPDTSSPIVRILGKQWYHYIPPAHLHFFGRKNISLMLKKHGFNVEHITYFGKYVSLAEVVLDLSYILESQSLRRLSEKVALHPRFNVNIPYMAYDDMIVVARKTRHTRSL